ncbi:MAG TPA: radical SAM protein [Opitutaceae bacterium]|nr:radical SAM protein [Opitutaceae bacterium]
MIPLSTESPDTVFTRPAQSGPNSLRSAFIDAGLPLADVNAAVPKARSPIQRPAPSLVVLWRVHEACNLACSFCAYDRRLRRSRRSATTDEVHAFSEVLASWSRDTKREVLISWLGGEPLLWPALTEASRHCASLGLSLSLTTNGTLLSRPEIQSLLHELYTEITISVDAPGETHDRLRGWPGGYAFLRRHVSQLAESIHTTHVGPKLRANAVIMQSTWKEFPRLCTELASWGIQEISFNQLGGNDRPEFYPTERLSAEDAIRFVEMIPSLRTQLAARGVRLVGGEAYLQRILASSQNRRIPIADCGPGQRFLFIDEGGRVSPCSFTSDLLGVATNAVRSSSSLAQLSHVFRAARDRQRPLACNDCLSTQVCQKFSFQSS